jgi:hypothetical protein
MPTPNNTDIVKVDNASFFRNGSNIDLSIILLMEIISFMMIGKISI